MTIRLATVNSASKIRVENGSSIESMMARRSTTETGNGNSLHIAESGILDSREGVVAGHVSGHLVKGGGAKRFESSGMAGIVGSVLVTSSSTLGGSEVCGHRHGEDRMLKCCDNLRDCSLMQSQGFLFCYCASYRMILASMR